MQLIVKRGMQTLLVGVVATVCLLSSCKTTKPEIPKKVLRLCSQSEPISLDPRIGGMRFCQVYLRQLFEGLTRIQKNGKPELAAAESVNISEDGLTYRFKLKDAFWSNGEKVTAYDFEHSWKTVLTPNFPTNYPYAFYIIKGAREVKAGKLPINELGVKALDDKTLTVTLTHPAPYFLEMTANPLYSPVCKKVDVENPNWSKNGGMQYVTNGPFTLTTWQHQKEFVLDKNPHYIDRSAVKLDGIHVSIIEDQQTALNLFEKKELDIVGEPFSYIPLEAIPNLIEQGKLQTQEAGGLYWYEINIGHKLLSSPKIRKALALAINREELTKHLLQGGEKPAFSVLPDCLTLMKNPLFRDCDIKEAKRLFNEGLTDLNLTTESVEPLVISHWTDARDKALAATVQQQWQQTFNIPVELQGSDWSTFFKKVCSSDYQIAGFSWFTWYMDPFYNLEFMKFKTGGMNGTNWEDQRFIQYLDLSDKTHNLQARAEYLRQAEELIVNEMPLIPVFAQTYKFMQNDLLTGVYLTPVGQLELKHADFKNS